MKKKFSGITLVEILLVIAIIAILASITVPSLKRFYRIYKFNEYSFETENLIKWAKITAIEQSSYIWICIEKSGSFTDTCSGGNGCKIEVYNVGTCSESSCSDKTALKSLVIQDNWVTITRSTLFPKGYSCLTFDPRGLAKTSGNICITDGNRYYKITLQLNRGTITVNSGDGGCS